MIAPNIQDEFNKHIAFELFSSHLYLSMAAWCENRGLTGFSNWMRRQAQEEHQHALKFFNFLLVRGGKSRLGSIDAPRNEWESPLAVFEDAQAHEAIVTKRIHALVDVVLAARDHAAGTFLQWFVNEQVEEEATVGDVVSRLRLVGQDGRGVLLVDQELQQRPAPPPPGKSE